MDPVGARVSLGSTNVTVLFPSAVTTGTTRQWVCTRPPFSTVPLWPKRLSSSKPLSWRNGHFFILRATDETPADYLGPDPKGKSQVHLIWVNDQSNQLCPTRCLESSRFDGREECWNVTLEFSAQKEVHCLHTRRLLARKADGHVCPQTQH